jgi:chorismate synthase
MIRYLTAGESHGKALVGIIEGMPAGVEIDSAYINHQLWRRQQGYGRGGRMKIESDAVEILSGIRFGRTMGSPVALMIQNRDWKNWTEVMSVEEKGSGIGRITIPRPGHADYAGSVKYGQDDLRNIIERSSARETAMRVALCTLARKLLEDLGIFIGSHVLRIGTTVVRSRMQPEKLSERLNRKSAPALCIAEEADRSEVRMLDRTAELKAISEIKRAKKAGDTLGGVFEVLISGLPIGLGSHVHYDRKLDSLLAQALMSVQAIKGVEIGEGFLNAARPGSEVHDEFILKKNRITRKTNRAGGIEGSMTNGEMVVLRAAMKPIATLAKPLGSVDLSKNRIVASRYERSDICAVPAASVIGEAVVAPVIANAFLEKYGGDSLKEIRKRYS